MPAWCCHLTIDAWADALERVGRDRSTMVAAGLVRAGRSPPAPPARRWAPRTRQRLEALVSGRPTADRGPVPALRSRHRADRRGDEPDRHRARRARPRGARRHGVALVSGPRRRSRVGGQVGPAGDDTRGVRSPGSIRSRATTSATSCAALQVSSASALSPGITSWRGGRVDAVIAMSPPLTLGLTGWTTHLIRRGPLIFNIQDVFPDAAIQTGAITNKPDHRRGKKTGARQLQPCRRGHGSQHRSSRQRGGKGASRPSANAFG